MLRKIFPLVLLVFGFVFYTISFEPFGVAEGAYIFSAFLLWASVSWGFSKKAWLVLSFIGAWLSWIVLLVWLRFVYPPAGLFFLFGLSAIIAFFFWLWLIALKKFVPNLEEGFLTRFPKLLFLAFLWIVLEWLRSFIFTGFPWLLLAHSQWQRPAIIQPASIGGVYLVSVILIFFGISFGMYGCRIWAWHRSKLEGGELAKRRFGKFSIEFYIACSLVMASLYMYISNMPKSQNAEKLFRVGMVQTDFAGILNWDLSLANSNLDVLKKLTMSLKKADVDIVAWSESATPPMWPIIGVKEIKTWCENLSKSVEAPIIMGNGAFFNKDGKITSYNAAFYVSEKTGLDENFYAKQKLVPFGEYLPSWCFFLKEAVVPVGGMTAGDKNIVFDCDIKGKKRKISPIICYEDIFPQIARGAVKAGADFLYVCTNDSWYGREGGAWQHATHSAFQAVSFRKPLLRASINGLSGVFDQYGRLVPSFVIRNQNGEVYDGTGIAVKPFEVVNENGEPLNVKTLKKVKGNPLLNDENSIYFRGAGFADLVTYKNFDNVETFYAKYGDWLPKIALLYLIFFLIFYKKSLTKSCDY